MNIRHVEMFRCCGVVLLLSTLAACQSVKTTDAGAVGVNRKQHMAMVSEQQVEQGAAQAYAQQMAQARAAGALNVNTAETVRVRRIAARLIDQTDSFRKDAKNWGWQINVLSTRDMNAYCMPGGRIMVYTGLMERLSLTDAELATVLAHEIAHALREHSREQMSHQMAQQAGLGVLGAIVGLGDAPMQLASALSDVTFTLPKSREQESEADQIGLELMSRAGYDPHAAVDLWKKMIKAGQGGTPGFFSTHPSSSDRISNIEKLIPRVLPLYKAANPVAANPT